MCKVRRLSEFAIHHAYLISRRAHTRTCIQNQYNALRRYIYDEKSIHTCVHTEYIDRRTTDLNTRAHTQSTPLSERVCYNQTKRELQHICEIRSKRDPSLSLSSHLQLQHDKKSILNVRACCAAPLPPQQNNTVTPHPPLSQLIAPRCGVLVRRQQGTVRPNQGRSFVQRIREDMTLRFHQKQEVGSWKLEVGSWI